MLMRVVIVAVLIFATMVGVKNGQVLRAAGLSGSCKLVQTASDGTEVASCTNGRLSGRPDLTGKSCTRLGMRNGLEYWHCPAGVDSRLGG
jgi:hypothetical protein